MAVEFLAPHNSPRRAMRCAPSRLYLLSFLDLQEVQFYRRLAAEEIHHYAHFGAFHIDFGDRAAEIIERPIHNAHALCPGGR